MCPILTGHYVCDVFDTQRGWTVYNDSLVTLESEDQMRQRASQQAYMLFYVHQTVLPAGL